MLLSSCFLSALQFTPIGVSTFFLQEDAGWEDAPNLEKSNGSQTSDLLYPTLG